MKEEIKIKIITHLLPLTQLIILVNLVQIDYKQKKIKNYKKLIKFIKRVWLINKKDINIQKISKKLLLVFKNKF